jgi:tetratricopeptide (TPR) repeat protein
MAKRIILISSFPLLVAIAIIAIVLAGIGHSQPVVTPADIEQAKSQIISLVETGKLDDANVAVDRIMALPASRDKGYALQQIAGTYQDAGQADRAIAISDYVLKNWPKESFAVWAEMSMAISQVDKGNTADAEATTSQMIADYADNNDLPVALCVVADTYSWRKKFDKAEKLYGVITDKFPNSAVAAKARLAVVGVNALAFIEDKDYSRAKGQVDSMIADFNNQSDLSPMLFRIGQEFSWQHRYAEAKDVFDYAADKSSDTSLSQQAKLWSARSNVCSLISKATDTEVVAAIDKLMSDFAGDAGLAEAVYWISKEYEWKKGTVDDRTGWYDAPNSVYQRLMQQFSSSSYGLAAELDKKRLTHRMNIFKLLGSTDQNGIEAATDTMVAELNGRPEIAGELYWIACNYDEQPDKGPLAKQMSERIIREYPTTPEANKAVLDIRRLAIWDTLNSGDTTSAQTLMDKFIADFNQHPYAGDCLGRAADKNYLLALESNKQDQKQQAKDYFARAENVWNRIISANLPTDLGKVYYFVAVCRQKHGDWDGAITYCQKVVNEYPDFEYVCGAQAAIGWCYEALRDSNEVPKETVNPLIEEAYKAVLTNYTNCYISHYAALRLAELNLQRGDKITSAAYFRMFLEFAGPEDTRIKTVKAKLAAMEGTNQ